MEKLQIAIDQLLSNFDNKNTEMMFAQGVRYQNSLTAI